MIEVKKIMPNYKDNTKYNLSNKEYDVLEIDDDMPYCPDERYKIMNDVGVEHWVSDWDCKITKIKE